MRGRWNWLAYCLTGAVAVLGLATSGVLAVVLKQQQDRYVAHALARRAELVQATVSAETGRYVDVLQDLAVAVAAQSSLTAADFTHITSTVTAQRLSGVTGVSLVVPSEGDGVAAVQAQWRKRGAKDLALRPAVNTGRQHRFAVLTRNLVATPVLAGQDLAEAPESYEAMDRAARTGKVAVTRTYVFLRDRVLPAEQQQTSFAFAAPIYETRGGDLTGWLVMGMRGQDFLSRALESISQGLVEVALFDRSTPQGHVPVARWPRGQLENPTMSHTVSVQVAQRRWELVAYGTEQLGERRGYLPAGAAGAGGLITLLLTGLVLSLATSRQRALVRVAAATAALQADIDRREETERQLRQRDAELRGFVAMATHDLRGPLASATAHTELLTDQVQAAFDEEGREDLRRIKRGLGQMSELIEDLLVYATADAAPLRQSEVDLNALVRDVVLDRIAATIPPTHVRVGTLPTVVGDAGLLRQLLDNLVGNAIKYAAAGAVPDIEISASADGDGAHRIEIADRGIGIPEAHHATVFDAFHRAPGSEGRAGTGLGLAICRRVVTRHGGTIGVTGNQGGGTRIWFTLPSR
ncbi:ATP-binding protein [Micromonospora sp. NPDC049679]|uniref:sensor histidine kinase n=1 Tax=Micromonospora sp. NPDC049679 TaxID=3155920 RepID=UPI0033C818B4